MKFYTLSPRDLYWPYLMVNPRTRKELYKRKFKHAILDSGVEIFQQNPNLREYPDRFLWNAYMKRLTELEIIAPISLKPDSETPF